MIKKQFPNEPDSWLTVTQIGSVFSGITAKKKKISKEDAQDLIDQQIRGEAVNRAHQDLNVDRESVITFHPMEVSIGRKKNHFSYPTIAWIL